MTFPFSSSKKKIEEGKQQLIKAATNGKAYTPYMKGRINNIKKIKNIKMVNDEIKTVIFMTKREMKVLEKEARELGIYTNVKNQINNYNGLRGSFLNIRKAFVTAIRMKKSKNVNNK